ncbi:MarR family transcriptional regulator [Actinomadura madurae]|uniref:MarR family transcriptional regulator n=1 Tax=Actinomadura madurae TaxID=1993 RepID=UPI0027E3654B|nr:MarR family transcriptional regulator [Actinomadura madurae]
MPDIPDPIAEAHRQWSARWPEHADHMAAVTSVMRAQQLLLSRIEAVLKPFGLTFAAYEALRLLAFARTGTLPMGKMGARLMVHPASVTNVIGRLEQRGLVGRRPSPDDRRVVLATITPAGRDLAEEATLALNESAFGIAGPPRRRGRRAHRRPAPGPPDHRRPRLAPPAGPAGRSRRARRSSFPVTVFGISSRIASASGCAAAVTAAMSRALAYSGSMPAGIPSP